MLHCYHWVSLIESFITNRGNVSFSYFAVFFFAAVDFGAKKSTEKKLINFFNFKFILFTLPLLELNDDQQYFFTPNTNSPLCKKISFPEKIKLDCLFVILIHKSFSSLCCTGIIYVVSFSSFPPPFHLISQNIPEQELYFPNWAFRASITNCSKIFSWYRFYICPSEKCAKHESRERRHALRVATRKYQVGETFFRVLCVITSRRTFAFSTGCHKARKHNAKL